MHAPCIVLYVLAMTLQLLRLVHLIAYSALSANFYVLQFQRILETRSHTGAMQILRGKCSVAVCYFKKLFRTSLLYIYLLFSMQNYCIFRKIKPECQFPGFL